MKSLDVCVCVGVGVTYHTCMTQGLSVLYVSSFAAAHSTPARYDSAMVGAWRATNGCRACNTN